MSPSDLELLGRFSGTVGLHVDDVVEAVAQGLNLPVSVPRRVVAERVRAIARGQGGDEGAAEAAVQLEMAGMTAPQVVLLWNRLLDRAWGELQADWSGTPEELAAYQRALACSATNEAAAGVERLRRLAMERFAAGYQATLAMRVGMERLLKLVREVGSETDVSAMLARIARGTQEMTRSEVAVIWGLDREEGVLRPVATEGLSAQAGEDLHFALGEGLPGRAAVQCGLVETDLQDDGRAIRAELAQRERLRSAAAVPLMVKGTLVGVLGVMRRRPVSLDEDDQKFLLTTAAYAASLLEVKRLYGEEGAARTTWEATFDGLEDLAIVTSADGVVRRVNRTLCERLATTPPALIGKPVGQVLGWCEGTDDVTRMVLSNYAATSYEGEIPRLPGCTFRIQASPVQKDSGVLEGVIVILRDVTGRKRLEQQLLQAEKLSAIGGLVSGVAHELNNPLSSVLGFAELAAGAEGVPAEVKQQLTIIRDEAKRAAKIVKNLLAFARQHKPERKMTQINDLVQRVTELMTYDLRTSRVSLTLDLDEALPVALVDPNQIQQVLFNLLQNARHACEEKSAPGVIRVSTRTLCSHVVLSVSDSGSGVKPEHVSKIFEPFFTTKSPGKGTGLGLSVCYGIVQEHGGQIRFDNRPGEGVT
ncbi:MAG: GAF domain-containing protein, partial [Planctomycetes bacterium]|nr:GAF domain-containing protein [Planctomycetota bacterium]